MSTEDFPQLRQQAEDFRKAKEYGQAVSVYQRLWTTFEEAKRDQWVAWGYAFCLQKSKRYSEGLEVCREAYPLHKEFSNLQNVYAWCIYFMEIKVEEVLEEPRFLKAANGILRLSRQDDKYSPYTQTCIKVLKHLHSKENYPAERILEWTERIIPELLSKETFSFVDQSGKTRELASEKETWYQYRIKALYESEKYEECIQLANQALQCIHKAHYDNPIWWKRYIALSNRGLGKQQEALDLLESLYLKKPEGFIAKEIADAYYEMKEVEQAFRYTIEGLLSHAEIDKKVKMIDLLAHILADKGEVEEAKAHWRFLYYFKQDQEQKISAALQAKITQYQVPIGEALDLNKAAFSLKKQWEKWKFEDRKRLEGVIDNILPNGKAGFVKVGSRESYYFRISYSLSKKPWLQKGQRVSFYLEDAYDKKKQRAVQNAIKLSKV